MWKNGWEKATKLVFILAIALISSCSSENTSLPTKEKNAFQPPTEVPTLIANRTQASSTCVPITLVVTATPQPSPVITNIPIENPDLAYELLSLECRKEECLFRNKYMFDLPVGLATIKGYYVTIDHAWLDGKKYPCDSFVVMDSTLFIFVSLNNLMYKNSSQVRNEQNHPMITINLKGLEPSDTTLIKAATSEKPVSLRILLHIPLRIGQQSPCQTDIEILEVESSKKP